MKTHLTSRLSLFLFILFQSSVHAQVTNISGTINIYSQVVSTGGPCSNTLTVASALGFSVDDTVLIIQMKGAAIDTTNTVSFGTILNYNDAGNYEFGIISAIVSNTITLQSPLMRSYTPSGLVQLVRVPSYVDANVTGMLTCQAWNGTTGGVLAFMASGTVTMNNDIDVSGRGFRGGPAPNGIFICAQSDYYYNDASGRGGRKGEGIAEYITNKNDGRGSQANGGGGGNSNDSGGGGGGNSTDGGRGGDQVLYSPCTQLPIGGEPGRSMTYNTSLFKIFMGGGGGSGQQNDNNNVGVSGTNGGAVVFIKANSLTGNNNFIRTNGNNNTQFVTTDGSGGGGAGGTILLDVQNFSTQVNVEAKGGNGGNSSSALYCLGMGGGGSGGIILTPQASLPANVVSNLSGGTAGQNAASNPGCPNSNWGAAAGQTGGLVFNWLNSITPLNVIAGPDTTVCTSSPIQLNATGADTYTWFPTVDLSNPNIANPVATPTITTTYYVVGYSASCSDTDSVVITISPAIIANAGQDETICSNGSVQLNATGGTSYSWTPSAGLSNPNISNPVASPSSTTQYLVQVSDGICFGFDTIVVTVSASPVVSITGIPDICAGDSSILTASGANTYLWSTSQTSSAISVTPSVTTTYTVTGTDAIGCTATSTFTVNVNPLPVVAVSPPSPVVCMGDSITLTMSGALNYHWSNQAGIVVAESPDSTTVTVLINSSTTYTVIGFSAEGCSATISFVVTVNPNPVALITPAGPTTFCAGNSVDLTASPTGTYLWSTSETNQTINVTSSGTYIVTVTDTNGCVGTSAPVSVTVNPLPVPLITANGPPAFCQGNSVDLTVSPAGTYLWSTLETNQTINVSSGGTFTVTVTDANGCTGVSAPFAVTMYPLPVVSITAGGPLAFCQGGSVTLTAGGGISFLWSTSETTQNISVNSTGIYSVIVTDTNNCSNSATEIVTVYPLPPAVIAPAGPVSVCNNNPATLSANPGPGYSYQWFLNGNPIANAVTAQYSTTTLGLYSVQVTDSNGCSSTSAETAVISGGGPEVTIVSSSGTGCLPNTIFIGFGPQSITLTAVSANAVSFLWSTGATTQSITVTDSGSYSVTAYDASGCASPQTPQSQITINIIDIRCGQNLQKVILCHVPGNDTTNHQTLCVAPSAIASHLALHPGDCLGPCSLYYNRIGFTEGEEFFVEPYPNPFNNGFNLTIISSDDALIDVTVYDLAGRMVETYSYVSEKTTLGNNLTEGIYFADVIQGTKHQVIRLIKTK